VGQKWYYFWKLKTATTAILKFLLGHISVANEHICAKFGVHKNIGHTRLSWGVGKIAFCGN